MDNEELGKLLIAIRQIAEGVVRHAHQLEELKHRVAELERHSVPVLFDKMDKDAYE